MRNYLLFFFCAFLMATSCKNPQVEQQQQLYKEVMQIHDEVMPKMSELYRVKRALNEKAAVEKSDSTKNEYLKNVFFLNNADDAMMSWMKTFGDAYKTKKDNPQEAITFLTTEKEKIQNIKTLILNSIDGATKVNNANTAK